jgi:two-component system, OmpR family, sensor histidine kinase QseC
MRAQIELNGITDRDTLLHDLDSMARQVNQLLHLAEASEARNYTFEPVDVGAVAEDIADYLRPLAERRTVYLDVICASKRVVVQADPGAIFMLLRGSTRHNEGAGLGLSICAEIVAAHKWHLSAGSSAAGAEFTLTFRV